MMLLGLVQSAKREAISSEVFLLSWFFFNINLFGLLQLPKVILLLQSFQSFIHHLWYFFQNLILVILKLTSKLSPSFLQRRPLFSNIIMYTNQLQPEEQARVLASRMRNGTGAATLLHAQDAPTHHMDALQRFQKDFASYEKQRRDQQKVRRQSQLEKKRVQQLQRENKRWEMVQGYQQKLKQREQYSVQNQKLGLKRTANTNGLAYNPITLEYDRNPEGERLKRLDQDAKIRGYVRAHNMDYKGNSKYNPLTGQNRVGIEQVIPNELNQRFEAKKYEHYENMRLKVPSSANEGRASSYSRYY